MKETWKDIADMKGYMISSCGNIKSVDRTTQYPDGHIQKFKGRKRSAEARKNISNGIKKGGKYVSSM